VLFYWMSAWVTLSEVGRTSCIFGTFGSLLISYQSWRPLMGLTATLPVGYSPPIPIPTTTILASTSPE
jgi:hypothetical protein